MAPPPVRGLTSDELAEALAIKARLGCGWSALAAITGRNEQVLRAAGELVAPPVALRPAPMLAPRAGAVVDPVAVDVDAVEAAPVEVAAEVWKTPLRRLAPSQRGSAMRRGAVLLPLLAKAEAAGVASRALTGVLAFEVGLSTHRIGWLLRALSLTSPPYVIRENDAGDAAWRLSPVGRCYVETLEAGLAGPDGAP